LEVWNLDLHWNMNVSMDSRRHGCLASRISHSASRPRRIVSFLAALFLGLLVSFVSCVPCLVFIASPAQFQFLPPPLRSASSFVRIFFSRRSNSKKGGVQGRNPRHITAFS
jgi:hypothetical protein